MAIGGGVGLAVGLRAPPLLASAVIGGAAGAPVEYPFCFRIFGNGAASRGSSAEYPGNPHENSGMPPIPTAWWLRPVNSAARVGEHIAVTWKRLYRKPCAAMRS
jgi:hypothetical protein